MIENNIIHELEWMMQPGITFEDIIKKLVQAVVYLDAERQKQQAEIAQLRADIAALDTESEAADD